VKHEPEYWKYVEEGNLLWLSLL